MTMLLSCPWCGPRELEEFRFRSIVMGDRMPTIGGAGDDGCSSATDAYARVYERTNVTDSSVEYWQHERGCRAWLVVRRNPSTAEVLDVRMLAAEPEASA